MATRLLSDATQVHKAMLRGVIPVAVKMLNEETAGGQGGRDAFLREVVTLKGLVSPVIVQFLCALNPEPPKCETLEGLVSPVIIQFLCALTYKL